jgi:hypothetical protein
MMRDFARQMSLLSRFLSDLNCSCVRLSDSAPEPSSQERKLRRATRVGDQNARADVEIPLMLAQ